MNSADFSIFDVRVEAWVLEILQCKMRVAWGVNSAKNGRGKSYRLLELISLDFVVSLF